MTAFMTAIDSWLLAAMVAVAMVAAWWIGWWIGHRQKKDEAEAPGIKFNDASMALLGLLLGFTFAMSLSRHDQRRQMVVTEANALGDFYTCASLLNEPVRGQLQPVIREYTESLLLPEGYIEDEARWRNEQEHQNRMQSLVKKAVDAGTPVTVPLVNTFNEITSAHIARLAARRDRLQPSVVGLLFLTALVSMVLMGRHQGATADLRLSGTLAFVVLVCMTIWVILDLNQPYRGAIRVSEDPMRRVLSGMAKE
jgi:hypothetical protein